MQYNKTIDLLSLGNTIVDLEYKVDDSVLSKLNIDKGSMNLIDKNQRDELKSLLGDNVHLCNGGSVANSLFVAKLKGLNVHHIGVIGDDSLAKFVIEDYDSNQLGHSFSDLQKKGDTGCCFVLITPDGERTMLTYLGVSNAFQSSDLMQSLIQRSKQMFIEGYLVADDQAFELILSEIIPFAKKYQTKLIITLSDAGLISFFKERFSQLIHQHFDVIFCNFQEAAAVSGAETIDEFNLFFSELTNETIITDGPNGAFIISDQTVHHCATVAIDPVDTTGAGDSFAGTYLAMRQNGDSIDTAATKANQVSALVISNLGARPLALID